MKIARLKSIDAAKVICRESGIHIEGDVATKILDILESERKKQDRDTRHACAEAVMQCEGEYDADCKLISANDAHNACMNVKAV